MEELNRRIAIEIMGEEEPANPKRLSKPIQSNMIHLQDINAAWIEQYGPKGRAVVPKPFSERVELAMRAVDKTLAGHDEASLELRYDPTAPHWGHGPWVATIAGTGGETPQDFDGFGSTAPEAICRCLVAYAART